MTKYYVICMGGDKGEVIIGPFKEYKVAKSYWEFCNTYDPERKRELVVTVDEQHYPFISEGEVHSD